jgi:hypothetical protein
VWLLCCPCCCVCRLSESVCVVFVYVRSCGQCVVFWRELPHLLPARLCVWHGIAYTHVVQGSPKGKQRPAVLLSRQCEHTCFEHRRIITAISQCICIMHIGSHVFDSVQLTICAAAAPAGSAPGAPPGTALRPASQLCSCMKQKWS